MNVGVLPDQVRDHPNLQNDFSVVIGRDFAYTRQSEQTGPNSMSVIETIHRKLEKAPPDVARQVLEFIEAIEAAGLDPFATQLLIAKSPCGFRAAYQARAKQILVVRAPGCAPSVTRVPSSCSRADSFRRVQPLTRRRYIVALSAS